MGQTIPPMCPVLILPAGHSLHTWSPAPNPARPRCRYCGTLPLTRADRCKSCGAPQ